MQPWGKFQGGYNDRRIVGKRKTTFMSYQLHELLHQMMIISSSDWCTLKCAFLPKWFRAEMFRFRVSELHLSTGMLNSSISGLNLNPEGIPSAVFFLSEK